MMRSLWTGASGMVAQQLNIDVISNNLANVNTTGFKKSRAEFEDLMYQNMKIAGSITEGDNILPVGIQVGMGVRPTAVHKFFTQGDFQNTGNALDVAIEGDGFFQVDVNGELMYTRSGSFKLNQDGTVVTANGYILQPEFAVPADIGQAVRFVRIRPPVRTAAGEIPRIAAGGRQTLVESDADRFHGKQFAAPAPVFIQRPERQRTFRNGGRIRSEVSRNRGKFCSARHCAATKERRHPSTEFVHNRHLPYFLTP